MTITRRQALGGIASLGMVAALPLRAAGDELIRLNIPGPTLMPFYPLELISQLGIDRELGVRLAVRHLPSGVLAAEDMVAGNADFAGCGFPILPSLLARGKEVVAIATLSSGAPPYSLVVRKALAPSIRSIRDLRGRTIGVQIGGTSTKTYLQLLAEHWLVSAGLRPQDVRLTPIIQNHAGAHGALAGEIADAVFCEEPTGSTLVREGIGVMLASLHDPKSAVKLAGRDHIRSVLTASRQTIATRPHRVRKMVQMLQLSLKWIWSVQREEIPRRLGVSDPAQRADIVHALGRLPRFFSRDGSFSPAEIAETRVLMKSVGLSMPAGGDIASLVSEHFLR